MNEKLFRLEMSFEEAIRRLAAVPRNAVLTVDAYQERRENDKEGETEKKSRSVAKGNSFQS